MSWTEPLPWRATFESDTLTLVLHDPSGFEQARLQPHPDAATRRPAPGLLGDLVSAVDEGVDTAAWRSGRGVLRQGGEPILAILADGTTAVIDNGREKGMRRRFRTGSIHFTDRSYEVRHESRRRTTVRREDTALATLRRTGVAMRSFAADAGPTYRIRFAGNAHDHRDELALVLVATVLGPPGRPGGGSRFWHWVL
ncbi:hypothetical protein [Nocardioides sp. AE5]|uniref:hypothetical protein n=1 Tax=Nocardioides sp. AE5 TaxID=2962573 RepID=UPI002880D72B|nr:hypothetical protein [Nocardioides sp. AE5]MDT0201920.1 hypothetical protein [Nocardioides sp. AE5]